MPESTARQQPSEIVDRLQAMDDFQIVRFFQFFSQSLVESAKVDSDTLLAAVPSEVRSAPGFAGVVNADEAQAERLLNPAEAARAARAVLLPLARDPATAPIVRNGLAEFRDDKLAVDVVIAFGVVASVLLIAATVEFDGKIGNFTFKKGKVEAETLKAITEPLLGLLKK
jgi:hypothetical protein